MKTPDLKTNRTGIGTSPLQGNEMVAGAQDGQPNPGPVDGLAQVREGYIAERVTIGSMPPPTTPTGLLKGAVKRAQDLRPNVFLDRLGERLAFERTSVRLYDAFLSHLEVLQDPKGGPQLHEVRTVRDQEFQHFQVLMRAIEKMGGDPTVQTPAADACAVLSQGLVQVLSDPRMSRSQCMQAILLAELADNEGWQMLVDLARDMGETELAREFETCTRQENLHLERIRDWLSGQLRVDLVEGRQGVDS